MGHKPDGYLLPTGAIVPRLPPLLSLTPYYNTKPDDLTFIRLRVHQAQYAVAMKEYSPLSRIAEKNSKR